MELGLQKVKQDQELMDVEIARAIQEVQASMIIAKKYPRDVDAAFIRIMKACERFSLADQAEYTYPKGGKTITGASIRLAEVLAQNWGNMQFGIRELSQNNNESEVEAFAWDIETNTRQIKTFKVTHKRYTKAKGNVDLSDPRDIYEYVANNGARRMRACILGIIPGDIVEKALEQCKKTLKKGIEATPLEDQVRVVLKSFDSLGVSKEMIEKRLEHPAKSITTEELIDLKGIGRSIRDNMTSREEWFDFGVEAQKQADELTDKIKGQGKEPEEQHTPKVPSLYDALKKMRPSRSDKAMAEWKRMVKDNADEIRALLEKGYKEIAKKWNDACPGEPFPAAPILEPEIMEDDTEGGEQEGPVDADPRIGEAEAYKEKITSAKMLTQIDRVFGMQHKGYDALTDDMWPKYMNSLKSALDKQDE